ncbi:MAG: D-glycero-beta-D-manno-heptose 1,7-bisphosphate 7-phosphatase [Agarilytica sp.]
MPWIVLDRDGVINQDSDDYIKNAEEWLPIDGSIEAIAQLSQANYHVVIATNQSGLGRGLFSVADLDAMHQKLFDLVEAKGGKVEGIFYCPHSPNEQCDCRKPKTALLDQIEEEFSITLKGCPFVGDSLKDLQAGKQKSCVPILVKTGKGETTLAKIADDAAFSDVAVYPDLATYTQFLLNHHSPIE